MKNEIFAYFDMNRSIKYPVVVNNTYTDNFNEQIDSMSILLDNVTEDKRLKFSEPYHFVKIVNEGLDLNISQMVRNGIMTSNLKETWIELPIVNETYTILRSSMNIVPTIGEDFKIIISYKEEDYILNCECVDPFYYAMVQYSVKEYHKANYNGFYWGDNENRRNWTFMVVDTWNESETNIQKGIYRYEITLMNVVKI